jgi:hypothetical protein
VALWRTALRLAPFAVLPLVLGTSLGMMVAKGGESEAAKKKAHDYWKQNLATWKDAKQPEIVDVELSVALDPAHSHFATNGRYTLSNPHDAPIPRFALTGGFHWSDVKWTMNGKEYKPENRTSLFAFTPEAPIAPGARSTSGFSLPGLSQGQLEERRRDDGVHPAVGRRADAFGPAFVPDVGYDETSASKRTRTATRRGLPDDFYVGRTEPAFGSGSAFTARVTSHGPGGVSVQLDRRSRIGHGEGRRAHARLEDRPQGADASTSLPGNGPSGRARVRRSTTTRSTPTTSTS